MNSFTMTSQFSTRPLRHEDSSLIQVVSNRKNAPNERGTKRKKASLMRCRFTVTFPSDKLSKTKTHLITFQENFLNIQNNFPDHHHIYTDGSKQEMKVGCAAVFQSRELLKRLPNESSIYSAEVIAIDLAMNIIANHKSSKFIIYSDSTSVLQALQSKDSSTPLITRLLDKMNTLSKNNSIILTWIPDHIGIQGNERADRAAKKALQTCISNTKIPYTDLKPLINKFIIKKWLKSWDDQTQNKLHHIQDIIDE